MEISIFIGLLSLLAAIYLLIMVVITSGWFRIERYSGTNPKAKTMVSVVVAMRNEEDNILQLLQHLYAQDYPQPLIEIILVDDHSEDETKNLIGKFRKAHNIKNIVLEKSSGKGKKAAIARGVRLATGELILSTDADCVMESNWVSSMAAYYDEFNPKLLLGPVICHEERGIFQRLFALDFASLVAAGAGAVGSNRPLMGNGANLAFSRQDFNEIDSTMKGKDFASGDDVFLLQTITRKYGQESVHFIKDSRSLVKTKPPKNIIQFFSQRIRWASKAKAYQTVWTVMVPLTIALFNLILAASFVAGFFNPWLFLIFLLFVILKFLADMPLLFDFLRFSDKRGWRFLALPLEFIYPFYISIAAFLSLFVRYNWKGRRGLK